MNKQNNYVPATIPATTRKRRADLIDANVISVMPSTIDIAEPLQTYQGATEKTSGMDRSLALVVRMMPFTVVWLILAVGVSWAASMGGGFTLILFSGLTSVTYGFLDRQERQFSRNGLERHKVDTLADLKMAEMDHAQELRRMALQAHLKMLGVDDDDD